MTRNFGLVLAGALLTAGCSDYDLSQREDPNLGAAPQILVEPMALDFGSVADGEQEIRQFMVSNIGDATLHVDGMTLVGDTSFTILSTELAFNLEPIDEDPSQMKVIDVAFSPDSDDPASGQVLVNSDDGVNPQVPVDLSGFSSAPYLVISPDPHDFGTQYVGIDCTEDQVLTLTNEGLEDLNITDIQHGDPTGLIYMTQSPTVPTTLAPGQSTTATVRFDATTSGNAQGTMAVTSNDPRGVVNAFQYADTQHALVQTDSFVQPTEVPVDILFAIDQSCSMDARLTNLQANFGTFIGLINDFTQAWRIGVATLDGGCFNSGFIENSTPNYSSVFNSAVVLGTQWTGTEYLFSLASQSLTAGCNAGFTRPGALLHIVFVSDEAEQGPLNAQQMYDNAVAAKGGVSSLVKMSGIICPDPLSAGTRGCTDSVEPVQDAQPGEYADAVVIGGGVRLDITSNNWGAQVEELATASLTGIGRYELSQPADPDATEVYVNGQLWTDWYFDEATNSIVFEVSPPDGANIEVTYGVAINCN